MISTWLSSLKPSSTIRCQFGQFGRALNMAQQVQRDTQGYKVFNDPIHGSMELHPLLVKIIDTPQFQRLRNIKQLGGAYWVFPGATHNRFEHSIGVCYLAGQLVETLKGRQAELNITDEDVLCVQVAGLCHDLGRGPFSHVFEKKFLPKACQEKNWKHESASVDMFKHMVEVNNLGPAINQYNLDQDFIEELIERPQHQDTEWLSQVQPEKSYLYEIVGNERNGIDVDKWDYFARDCHHLGIRNNFDYRRFITFARVCAVVRGRKQLCIRDKEIGNVSDMFQTRRSLHLKAYQHRVIRIVEIMIAEAFLEADKHLHLSAAIYDMKRYTELTDHVFNQILTSDDPELKKPREILEKITKRDFYKFVGQTRPDTPLPNTQDQRRIFEEEIAQTFPNVDLRAEDFVVDIVSIDHRIAENNNPLDNVHVYTKSDPYTGKPIPEAKRSMLLPNSLAVQLIRVYCKKTDDMSMEASRKKFEQWCFNKRYTEWMEISTPPGPKPQQPQ